MDAVESSLRGFLANLLAKTPASVEAVGELWQQQRRGQESLAEFLRRLGVLAKDAARTLDFIAKGYLAPSCKDSVLEPRGLEILLASLRVREPEPASFTFGGDDPPAQEPPASSRGSSSRLRKPPPEVTETTAIETGPRAKTPGSTSRNATADVMADAWPPGCGTQIGKYLLTERIGQGTSGLVFRAVNQVLNLSVAVKILKVGDCGSRQAAMESLQAEARLLASLNHPNVVRLWDFEADLNKPYLVMEYVEGPSLAELIKQSGRLSPDRAVQLILGVLDGLAAAWAVGIVHRDVKPHNVLITRDGQPKIADLGLAFVVDSLGPQEATAVDFAGTAAYMAPEQGMLTNCGVDHRSDIYSIGATLYHALTGHLPYEGSSVRELMIKHTQERPIPPHLRVPGLSEAFSDVVLTMMARHPDDRYQTADELRVALKSLVSISWAQEAYTLTASLPARSDRSSIRPSGFWRRLLTGNQ